MRMLAEVLAMFPAASMARTSMFAAPGRFGVHAQTYGAARSVQAVLPSTTNFSSATPTLSDALAESLAGTPTGTLGGTASATAGGTMSEGALTITLADATAELPAASSAITRMVCTPGALGVQLQV